MCRFARIGATAAVMMSTITAHAQAYTLSTIVTFNGANGTGSAGLTADGSGNFYGTTDKGGTGGSGTVFKIDAGTNTLTTLASFNATADSGGYSAVTLDPNGDIYGTIELGGASNLGTVYKIAAGTNTITNIATFNNTNGARPSAGLTRDGNGNFYGTTDAGGASNFGTVFEIAAGTNTVTTLAAFNNTNGSTPFGSLTLDGNGNLYGTTNLGGASNLGTVFKIAAGTNTITTLATFNKTNGAQPIAGLTLDGNGNLYGTTASGGAGGGGTVFEISAATNSLTTLATFNKTNGTELIAGVTRDSNGNLFGATAQGGANSLGTVFEISSVTGALTTLATFNNSNGAYPTSTLTLDGNGNLYGTTEAGGANGDGTVFELKLSGSASAPEPSALLLLAPSAFGLLAVRRVSGKGIKRAMRP